MTAITGLANPSGGQQIALPLIRSGEIFTKMALGDRIDKVPERPSAYILSAEPPRNPKRWTPS